MANGFYSEWAKTTETDKVHKVVAVATLASFSESCRVTISARLDICCKSFVVKRLGALGINL